MNNSVESLVSDLEVGESVTVVDIKTGKILTTGKIDSISEDGFRDLKLTISGQSYILSWWRPELAVFKTPAFMTNLNQSVVPEYMECLTRTLSYTVKELTSEQLQEIEMHLKSIDNICTPAIPAAESNKGPSHKSNQSIWGNQVFDYKGITLKTSSKRASSSKEFLKDKISHAREDIA